MNATACWARKAHEPCSWNPWGSIAPLQNGGVPQAANITAHLLMLKEDLEAQIPDKHFAGVLIVDWEAWRPLYSENDDGLSAYREYSVSFFKKEFV